MDSPARLRTILVGVDGSPGAVRALTWAIARARESGASLLVVHVLTYSKEFRRDLTLDTVTTWRKSLDTRLRDEWARQATDAGVPTRCELVEDDSASAGLLRATERPEVDLIVLGAHGHGNLADRLLGATTYKVSHAAQVPVVIVPAGWNAMDA